MRLWQVQVGEQLCGNDGEHAGRARKEEAGPRLGIGPKSLIGAWPAIPWAKLACFAKLSLGLAQ